MKKEFPVHFVDKKRDVYYRIDGVKEIDTKTGKAFYKGATVYNDTLVGWYASDTVTFYIASWKDMEEITEEEFNTKYNNVKSDMEDNQWDFTSTNEFKEERFASVEPGYYENMVLTTEQHINELKMEMANAITYGYIDLTKRYGVLTPNGYILDVSATKFLFSNGPCYLQEISSCLGTVYITSKRGKELSKCRLEHCPNDAVDRARLLDMLVYYFEHL